jgi:amino acid transporter
LTSAAAPRLERVLGVGGLGCSIVNTIIGSGIFGLPGLAAAILGPAALVAYLVCVVLVGLVGLCFAEAGSRVPQAGGIYSYAMAAFGPVVGGIAGTLTWTANTIVPSAAVANLLVDTLSVVSPALGGGVVRMAILAGLYAVLAAVNVRGTRQGARVSMALAVIKVTPLVLLVLVGVFAVRAVNLEWTTAPTLPGIAEASVVLFFAFMGMEGNMAAGGEVVHPARTIPRAIFFALGLVGALYIGLQLVAQGVLGNALPNSTAPLVETASVVLGPWGGQLLLVTTVFSVLGYMSADVLCAPRNFQALASWGQLPRVLAQVHPRYKTPAVAIVTSVVLCTVVAWSGSFRQLYRCHGRS